MDIEQAIRDMRDDNSRNIQNIYSSIDEWGKASDARINRIELSIAKMGEHTHKPDACPGLARHEKDHEKSGSLLRTISTILGMVVLGGGLVVGVVVGVFEFIVP